jgi:16S rRNA (guanine1207-N2)-methyltransferase
MEPSSQVILRNESRLGPGTVLLVNPPRDELFQQLRSDERSVRVSTQDFGDFRWLSVSGASASFAVIPDPDGAIETIVLFLPREKERLVMMLHSLSSWMPEKTKLWLVGENKAGIKSAGRYLKQFFGQVQKLDTARHCALFEALDANKDIPFEFDNYLNSWSLGATENPISVVSLPGVFAHGRLDKGSRMLLDSLLKLEPKGKILDFACGSGVLGCSLLSGRADLELTLLDVSALAMASSRLTLIENGQEATLLPSDGLSELHGHYDWIISNPPFHRGISNDLHIAATFFSTAGTFLTKNGRIVIVCNRHLPYKRWLQEYFEQVVQLDENAEFLIIQAAKPRNNQMSKH